METINTILVLLFLIAFMGMVIGLIRPSLVIRWGEKRNRGRVLLYYGVGAIAAVILSAALEPDEVKLERARKQFERGTKLLSTARTAYDSQNYQTAIDSADEAISALKSAKLLNEASSLVVRTQAFLDSAKVALEKQKEEEKEGYTTKPGTLARIVEKHGRHVFGKTVRRDGKKVASVISISIGYTADVAYREDGSWSSKSTRELLIVHTGSFMERVFTDPACSEVQRIRLRPYFVFTNQYGHPVEAQGGAFELDRKVAEKLNWNHFRYNAPAFERLLKTEGRFQLHNALNK